MRDLFLSHFTPSLMRHEDLEAIFVQDRRKRWVDAIVQGVREAALGGSIPSYLTIGARGMGKTHILSLVYHRLEADPEMEGKLALAWLREEEWGVASFLDLLMRLLSALDSEEPDADLADRIAAIPDARDPEAAAANLLLSAVGERVLAVLIENLDDLFAGMGDIEEKRLRAFLQDHRFCSLVATAPALFSGIRRETSAFYGFFAIEHLSELSLDEARDLLVSIARREPNNDDLIAALESPVGRARVRAVHHLAGGNPRVYVIFYQFLTCESLDELVEPFMRMIDELTPYYQSRMHLLPQQQRKIVIYLCEEGGAVPVKQIARDCFTSHQTASSQLRELLEQHYVKKHETGRESWYELCEPLMRLCFAARRHRGAPVRPFLQLLAVWFLPTELEAQARALCECALLSPEDVTADVREGQTHLVHALVDKCKELLRSGDARGAADLGPELLAHHNCLAVCTAGEAILAAEGPAAVAPALEPHRGIPAYWLWVARAQRQSGDYEGALASADHAVAMRPGCTKARLERVSCLSLLWRDDDALAEVDRLAEQGYDTGVVGELRQMVTDRAAEAAAIARGVSDIVDRVLQLAPEVAGYGFSEVKKRLAYGDVRAAAAKLQAAWGAALPVLPDLGPDQVDAFDELARAADMNWLWRRSIDGKILPALRTHGLLPELLKALLRAVPIVTSPEWSQAKADKWLRRWQRSLARTDDSHDVLRMLEAAIQYKAKRDERVLLRLPVEQRTILQPLLDAADNPEVTEQETAPPPAQS